MAANGMAAASSVSRAATCWHQRKHGGINALARQAATSAAAAWHRVAATSLSAHGGSMWQLYNSDARVRRDKRDGMQLPCRRRRQRKSGIAASIRRRISGRRK